MITWNTANAPSWKHKYLNKSTAWEIYASRAKTVHQRRQIIGIQYTSMGKPTNKKILTQGQGEETSTFDYTTNMSQNITALLLQMYKLHLMEPHCS